MAFYNAEVWLCQQLRVLFSDITFTNRLSIDDYDDVDSSYVVIVVTNSEMEGLGVHTVSDITIGVFGKAGDTNGIEAYSTSENVLDAILKLVGPGKPISLVTESNRTVRISNPTRPETFATFSALVQAIR